MERILNLTQHNATEDQMRDGVYDPPVEIHNKIRELLTVDEIPNRTELKRRAYEIGQIAQSLGAEYALIGSGVPVFSMFLEGELRERWIEPYYSFSRRVCVETQGEDGKVISTYTFKHLGLYSV